MDLDVIPEPDLTPRKIKELGTTAERDDVRTRRASNDSPARG